MFDLFNQIHSESMVYVYVYAKYCVTARPHADTPDGPEPVSLRGHLA